ncbi:MAG TPA: PilC/PilY family type IV pilus protein [Burkholderiales bacterium]|nr:PilC/PilY family type IV pilus protein [Burkholderiales bacterium]
MRSDVKHKLNRAVAAVALFCTAVQPTYAITFAQEPLFLQNRVPPKVMLTLSKDQQLYKKAYNDYGDLDNDGVIESTYKHSIKYYGYFDPTKCYNYSTANNRFEPVSITTVTETVSGVTRPGSAYCDDSTGRWSGNFLNWASMSRMDAVRKILFGGMRSSDTASLTVLERSFLPTDAHSFAKYYDGADIARLTPFSPPATHAVQNATNNFSFTLPSANGDYLYRFLKPLVGVAVGDQLKLQIQSQPNNYMIATVFAINPQANGNSIVGVRVNTAGVFGAGASGTQWTVTNLSSTGISMCNLTLGTSTSQATTSPPLLRVAQGNFALWNANEARQCLWSEERSGNAAGFGGVGSNGNLAVLSEMNSSAENPSQNAAGLGTGSAKGEYYVRIRACVSDALVGTEKCKKYGENLKPVGLMQTYADTIDFGLMTGSYAKNISGGVLRKGVGSFNDEVNSDGTFNASTNGIVKTLNSMRIYGYNYADGTYIGSAGDNCTYQLTSITENQCTSWGNPMSEIYYEAIRYFAAKTDNAANPAYTYTVSGAKDTTLGLPLQTWKAPMNAANACSKLNVLVFNASVSTNDDDLRNTVATDINSSSTIAQLTNAVGDLENITNGSFFVGKRVGDTSATAGFELCTQKTIAALGDVSGICPEGPTLAGSYLIAGLARHARTTPVRADLVGNGSDPDAMKVTSYGIQLATNTPQLEIPVPTKAGQKIVIQPIYRLVLPNGTFGGGALVDMKFVRTSVVDSRSTGKVYINWEDSEQGGDYDQDMWGTLEWDIDAAANTVKITTNAISASTSNPQGFGYTIAGTTQDGPHFHSGILGFNFTDTVTAQPANFAGCRNCQVASASSGQRGAQSVTYTLDASKTASVGSLKDPLWYLAKYGGFDDRNKNGQLDGNEWDVQNNLTGEGKPDGIPDTYFLVTNPLGLEQALERAFRIISQTATGTSLAANSTSVRTDAAVFGAQFRSGEWSGTFSAFGVNEDGSLTSSVWEAAAKLPAPDTRVILTYADNGSGNRQGVAFRWPGATPNPATDISKTLVDSLNTRPDVGGTQDNRGAERLQYLRGDSSKEGNALDSFRPRTTKLGDIINSNPVYVPSLPNDPNVDASYRDFRDRIRKANRTPMVYVAANDGMLHGFDATALSDGKPSPTGGVERFAYIPSKTHTALNQLTNPTYTHRYYVDGSPTVSDAFVGKDWKTVLVGTLGRGDRGIYALDVTLPPEVPSGTDSTAVEQKSATTTVMWEFNVEDDIPSTVEANRGAKPYGLGYSIGKPIIRKMQNGKWAAIVSGGYNNTETIRGVTGTGDGKGYIYVIFLDGPTGTNRTWQSGVDYVRLDTGLAGDTTKPNGLAPPNVIDANGDGMVDFIYAGDLLGNFWKFDVSDKVPGNWNGTNNRLALYSPGPSGEKQPITTTAQATVHPSNKGYVLNFGTGKYFESNDPLTTEVQSFFGIWDENEKKPISGQKNVTDRAGQLFEQKISTQTTANGEFRANTTIGALKGPDYATQRGWFMDLPGKGERIAFDPIVLSRRLVFTTLVPSGGACDFGGTSFLMVVNPATGGPFDAPVIDVNGDGKITSADMLSGGVFAVGVSSSVGITNTPRVMTGGLAKGETAGKDGTLFDSSTQARLAGGGGNRRGTLMFCGAGSACTMLPIGLGRDQGRTTWREVVRP